MCRHFSLYKQNMNKKKHTNKHFKLAILMLGADANICDDLTFFNEYEMAKETWANNLPKDIALIYYDGGKYMKNEFIDEGNNHYILHLACEDDMKWTYKKTWLAYTYIYNNFDVDWYFRTNTSTYVNIDLLQTLIRKDIVDTSNVYCSDIYSLSEACCPYPLCLYPRGNGILMPCGLVYNTFIRDGMRYSYLGICDDIAIGNMINSYFMSNGANYIDHIKGLPHGWYKTVDVKFSNRHKLCRFGEDRQDPKFWNNFVTIQYKKYRDREKEKKQFYELHNIMKQKESPDLDTIQHYMDNYSIFIGSVLGYIDFETWDKFDKNELYLMEISHKACDDEQYYKYEEIQGKNL